MGGGKQHPGFPNPNPTVSHWQDPPHRLASHRTTPELPTDEAWDHVIIGSGISGAAIAHKLLTRKPLLRVLMLEARTAASGASGRNGGHCRPGWWSHFRRYAASFGEAEALRLERHEEQTVADVAAFVREHGVRNDFQDVETADVFTTDAAFRGALDALAFRDEVRARTPGDVGPSVERTVWRAEDARARLGIPGIAGAITYPAHAQNPYLLVCRMLELALDAGLNLQTNTPALSVEEEEEEETADGDGAKWTVRTERGAVRARNVVLATNAYTNSLYRGLAATGFLTPARSQVAALRPGSGMDYGYLTGHSGGPVDVPTDDYYMTTPAGVVVWGGGRCLAPGREVGVTDDGAVDGAVAAYLHDAPRRFYGAERWGRSGGEDGGAEVVRDWSGITCYTPDTLPLVGQAPGQPGLWMSVGMNGHGMALAFRCAEALVHMLTEGKGEPPEWFPRSMRLARAWEAPKLRVEGWVEGTGGVV
ncbi:hypothetical protein RB598_006475 [Gaeumannomyces tritici]